MMTVRHQTEVIMVDTIVRIIRMECEPMQDCVACTVCTFDYHPIVAGGVSLSSYDCDRRPQAEVADMRSSSRYS